MTTALKTSIPVTTVSDTMHTYAEVVDEVNRVLASYYSHYGKKAHELHPRFGQLLGAMQNLTMAGGKRIRPYLCMFIYEAYGGNQFEDVAKAGAALELLHAGLLIHDDIIDRDLVRHGTDNVAGRYRKILARQSDKVAEVAHIADSAALLAGDIHLTTASQLILDTKFSAELKLKVLGNLTETMFRVAGGELIDSDAGFYDEPETDPLIVAAVKTAHYSFVTPLLCGAILAEVAEEEFIKLTNIGNDLGIAFQLQDDLLGIFGREETTGKSALGDIREGKQTWLYQAAKQHSNGTQLKQLERYYGNPDVTGKQAELVRKVLTESGAKAACKAKITEYTEQARIQINTLAIGRTARKQLDEFVIGLLTRSK